MPLKEIFWDVRAVVEKYGAKQYVKLGYNGYAIKQKLYFSNVQCDVDDKHIIFPYFTKKALLISALGKEANTILPKLSARKFWHIFFIFSQVFS